MIFHAALGRQWDGVAQYLPQSTSAAQVVLAMLMTSWFAHVRSLLGLLHDAILVSPDQLGLSSTYYYIQYQFPGTA